MVFNRLHDWFYNNGSKLPKNILYFRDGVSDSQYEEIKRSELQAIRNAVETFLEQVEQEDEDEDEDEDSPKKAPERPKWTAVICTKRHHTRFYPEANRDIQSNGNNNCKPGTLVERSVTHPYFTDFYLQSHNGIKGTARPAHYFVLENEMQIPVVELQYLVIISSTPTPINNADTQAIDTQPLPPLRPCHNGSQLCQSSLLRRSALRASPLLPEGVLLADSSNA
jgi:eukaryotic translation initiation factor 2C